MDTSSPYRPSEDANLGRRTDEGAVLVIGATGVLAPAVAMLLIDGRAVLGVARHLRDLQDLHRRRTAASPRLCTLAADARDPAFVDAVDQTLSRVKWRLCAAIVYGPATLPPVIDALTGRWSVPLVEILTSSVAQPHSADAPWALGDLPAVGEDHRRLVLGWRSDRATATWHDADQISRAALEALTRPGDQQLGTLRPWSSRPQ